MKISTTKVKLYAITYWIMARLGFTQPNPKHTKSSGMEKRNFIVQRIGKDADEGKITIVDEGYQRKQWYSQK
jgi:hypothetical protein